jgi:hypothetical protein
LALERQKQRIVRMRDPGAQSATAPRPSTAASTTVHGAQAKPADRPHGALLRSAHGHPDAGAGD